MFNRKKRKRTSQYYVFIEKVELTMSAGNVKDVKHIEANVFNDVVFTNLF